MFLLGFAKQAQKEVAKAGIFYKGRYLMGVRQDNGKWTEPGGHLHRGEDPLKGVAREVKEETGMSIPASQFKPLGSREVPVQDGKIVVHAFRADLDREPKLDVSKDPDHEVFGWNWIPLSGKALPQSVDKNLHVPAGRNVLHYFLGFERKARSQSPEK